MLAELEALAARVGVVVRAEPFGKGVLRGKGGLCHVDGKPLVVMDAAMALEDRIGVLAGALATLDLGGQSVALAVRERIEAERPGARGRAGRKTRAVKRRGKPGLARARPRGR
ncbi:MAG TPA: hypothetical protein VIF09_10990 [Polyangiaceae bacterium]